MFRLALRLGRTVKELLDSIDSYELTEWMAFERLEPFSDLQADFRAGAICASIVNLHVPEGRPARLASDFMPTLAELKKQASPPVQPMDPQEHSDLLDAVLFGKPPNA